MDTCNDHPSTKEATEGKPYSAPTLATTPRSFEDGETVWPRTLYEEAHAMLIITTFSYEMAKYFRIKEIAMEKGEMWVDTDTINQTALTPTEIRKMFQRNQVLLNKYTDKFQTNSVLFQMLDILEERQKAATMAGFIQPLTCETFRSDYSEEELVFGVTKDSVNKRITIAFRGTNTSKDWLSNLDFRKTKVELPQSLKKHFAFNSVNLHSGWYDYLFAKTATETDAPETTKYDEIVTYVRKLLLTKCPGYKLYLTGHSMGGALSIMIAFLLTTSEPDIPKPISCITFASPKIGDSNYAEVMEHLQVTKQIRLLRVVNDGDQVSSVPPNFYYHAGPQVTLYRQRFMCKCIPRPPKIHNLGSGLSCFNKVMISWDQSICGMCNLRSSHKRYEYYERLNSAKQYLEDESLNELYLNIELMGFRFNDD